MSTKSVILYDSNQNPMEVRDGVAIPANTSGVLVHGEDDTSIARSLRVDSVGNNFTKITDGTNEPVSVKDASTVPDQTDKAMVVVISPNQQAIPISAAPALAAPGLVSGYVTLGGGTANTENVIRATPYIEPTAAAQRSVASSSSSDTSGGTGTQSIGIVYYDDTGNGPFEDTVTLNGTTPVATPSSNIRFIERIYSKTIGTNGSNVGAITLYVNNSGGGGTIGSIGVGSLVPTVGDRQTLWAHHYVATGITASLATFIVSAYSGGSGTRASFVLKAMQPLVSNDAELRISDILVVTASFVRILGIPIEVQGFRRITAYGVPGVNNTILSASFDFAEL